MPDEMEEITTEFITESEESLDRIEPLFVELEKKGQDNDLLNDIFRAVHTIKGAAGFLGFQSMVDVAHASENILKKLRDGDIALSKSIVDAILKSLDMLRLLLQHLKAKDGIEEDITPVVRELGNALKSALGEKIAGDEPTPARATEGAAQLAEDASPTPQTPEGVAQAFEGMAEPIKTLQDIAGKTLRVDINRIDKVMDLAGEVVLVRNRLLNISRHFEQMHSDDPRAEELLESVSFLDRVTSDMQLAVMRMRMQPIKKVLSKFPRLVRDVSRMVKKDIDLQIFGEDTEVDKSVIENIADPMSHILRNSIDHGIETTEERLAKGKPAKGKIIINIYQKGNHIVIEIFDDGKGMDVGKLKEKALEKALITEEEAQRISDEAAADIIFLPGFSTKETVTELSGRGVGMDVVKTNISQLNGFVEITTRKEIGTTFRITLPLTLAIIQTLMVDIAGAKYAIPLSLIEETLRVSRKEIDEINGQSVVYIRDRVCPMFELNSILGMGANGRRESDYQYLVVVSMGDKKFCVAVDKLLGQEEAVIKTPEGIDTGSSYVLGATITGDGRVVFILDLTGMSRDIGITKC